MLQEFVRDPALHGMAIAALFGKLECEVVSTVDPDGERLREQEGRAMANPWARQVMSDLWHLAQCEEGEEVWEMLDERPLRSFEADVAKALMAIDVTALRARALSEAELPPGTLPAGIRAAGTGGRRSLGVSYRVRRRALLSASLRITARPLAAHSPQR